MVAMRPSSQNNISMSRDYEYYTLVPLNRPVLVERLSWRKAHLDYGWGSELLPLEDATSGF